MSVCFFDLHKIYIILGHKITGRMHICMHITLFTIPETKNTETFFFLSFLFLSLFRFLIIILIFSTDGIINNIWNARNWKKKKSYRHAKCSLLQSKSNVLYLCIQVSIKTKTTPKNIERKAKTKVYYFFFLRATINECNTHHSLLCYVMNINTLS